MGRAPCCDKSKVKRGPWSPDEDLKLISFIHKHGHDNWRSLPKQAGLMRCGKSCRLRWINYLRPDLKRGNFTEEEEDTIIKLHQTLGNKWSKIAAHLPGRTDNEIKNVWHTHLKKRLVNSEETNDCADDQLSASSCSSDSVSRENPDDLKGSVTEISCSQRSSCPNELLCSSISSSGGSNFLIPEDHIQTSSLIEYSEGYSDIMDIMFQEEVDKPYVFEILFDSSQESSDGHENGSRRMAEEADEEEVRKWFKYLENELGLEEDNNKLHNPRTGEEKEAEETPFFKSCELMID